MGGMVKQAASAPVAPKQVAGGGIETPIKEGESSSVIAAKKKKDKQAVSLLGQGGERKVGL
jgi:hypothetical protein